jgi:predicted alpha/beta superfamily hydrolase
MSRFSRRKVLLSTLTLSSLPFLAPGRAIAAAGQSGSGQGRSPVTVLRSEQFNLKSETGREFVIQVGFPHDIDSDLPVMVRGRKPVALYVLDGDLQFGMVRDLTRMMQWGGDVPPCLVVGITYPPEYLDHPMADKIAPRNFDLTPTPNAGNSAFMKAENAVAGGGGPAFLAFLEGKLIPLIRQRYEVDPDDSVLVGHSLGGLFTIGASTQSSGGLRHYLALSPSLWWDERFELKRFERSLKNDFHHPGRLAVYVGEREERIAGALASMVGNVVSLKGVLENYPTAFEKTLVQILPDEDHHTLHAIAISKGLRFLLN